METLKKYWMYIVGGLVIVYLLFFNKKGKTIRRKSTRRIRRGYSFARSSMRRRMSSYRTRRNYRRSSRRMSMRRR